MNTSSSEAYGPRTARSQAAEVAERPSSKFDALALLVISLISIVAGVAAEDRGRAPRSQAAEVAERPSGVSIAAGVAAEDGGHTPPAAQIEAPGSR